MKTNFDVTKYKEQRDDLRRMFEAEKTGEQSSFTNQAKFFKPVIESQKESQDVLVPLVRELQRRNTGFYPGADQVRDEVSGTPFRESLPYYAIPEVPEISSTPKTLLVDVDKDLLNDTNRENLQDMGLDLPSIVQKTNSFEAALKKVESQKRSIGQYLGEKSKKSEEEKGIYRSQRETLKIYKAVILGLQGAQQFLSGKKGEGLRCRPKRGKGRPKTFKGVIVYGNPDDLVGKLSELFAAREAGHTGVDNTIVDVLDELLRIKEITKNDYDQLHTGLSVL